MARISLNSRNPWYTLWYTGSKNLLK
jgi:hypothetical protein